MVAAAGSASTAPTGPRSAAPAMTDAEGDGGVDLHRAGRDARGEQVVLDLLVQHDEAEHEQRP